jgi:hypothetical protein
MPFSSAQFFAVFAEYNQAVWPLQILFCLLAAVCVLWVLQATQMSSRLISATLALLWVWMAVAYHFAFFASINPAAWLFGSVCLIGAGVFVWFGIVKRALRFEYDRRSQGHVGMLMMAFALLGYPAIAYAVGHRYPSVPTFGLPCPTTIFTLGALMCSRRPTPWAVYLVPLLWSGIGSIAAFQLGVTEDLALLVAGLVALLFRLRQ